MTHRDEYVRMRAQLLAQESRIRELEEALARCMTLANAQRVRLQDVLRYYEPETLPPSA